MPEEPAFLDGRLTVGDRIESVNGIDFSRISHDTAAKILKVNFVECFTIFNKKIKRAYIICFYLLLRFLNLRSLGKTSREDVTKSFTSG